MADPTELRRTLETRQRELIEHALRQAEIAKITVAGCSVTPSETPFSRRRTEATIPSRHGFKGYRLEGQVHRGGQGVVYRAIQESTGQVVAIKVILGGRFAGPQQISRFEREIRILAQLKHPNIVTIHDRGLADGVAYYVMEFIEGRPLDVYFREESPQLSDKLELVSRICEAVHAAHLHGVIHRDLKPGNLLVDSEGIPRVLDFGLAKPFGESEDGSSEMTQTGQFVGSLPWASPEQATGTSDGLDLRTDVYSLGVILYQSLTDRFPYSVEGSPRAVLERIATVEPRDPSDFVPRLDSELRLIVLKALEKDRDRRYQSAGALAEDIHRYLAGEPIDAKRSSLVYLIRKRIERHKWLATMAAFAVMSILIGFCVAISLWRLASQREVVARKHANRAQAAQNFLTDTLTSANVFTGGAADVTVHQVIDESVRKLDEFPLKESPDVESHVRLTIGRAYGSLGLHTKSEGQLELARKLALEAAGEESETSLEASVELIGLKRQMGFLEEAEKILQSTLPVARRCLGEQHLIVIQLVNVQGVLARERGDFSSAVKYAQSAVEMGQRNKIPTEEFAILINDLALALQSHGKLAEAIPHQEKALSLFQESLGDAHFRTAICMSNLAGMKSSMGEEEVAEELYTKALQIFESRGGAESLQAATCLDAIGRVHVRRKEFAKAAELHRKALAIRRAGLPANHLLIAHSLNNFAICHYELGDLGRAAENMNQALQIYESVHGSAHPTVASLLNNLAAVEWMNGKLETALTILQRALKLRLNYVSEDHPELAKIRHNLARVLDDLGQFAEAEDELRKALAVRQQVFGERHAETLMTMDSLATVLRHRQQLEEAEATIRRTLDLRNEILGKNSIEVAESLNHLVGILVDQGKSAEALPIMEEAMSIATNYLSAGDWRLAWYFMGRGEVFMSLGRHEESMAELRKSQQIFTEKFGADDHRAKKVQNLMDALERKE